jgi:hypothetical protein
VIAGRSVGGFILGLAARRILRSRLVLLVYVFVGLGVANSRHYFAHLDGWRLLASAVLAVLLWPLVLLGVDLHLK